MPRRACWSYIDNNSRIRVKEAPGQCVQWQLRARQTVRQRRDRFLKPHDVFNAARHRVDSSQSAACLVRAAFDPGERNGKENEETAPSLLRLKILQMILNDLEVPGLLCWF